MGVQRSSSHHQCWTDCVDEMRLGTYYHKEPVLIRINTYRVQNRDNKLCCNELNSPSFAACLLLKSTIDWLFVVDLSLFEEDTTTHSSRPLHILITPNTILLRHKLSLHTHTLRSVRGWTLLVYPTVQCSFLTHSFLPPHPSVVTILQLNRLIPLQLHSGRTRTSHQLFPGIALQMNNTSQMSIHKRDPVLTTFTWMCALSIAALKISIRVLRWYSLPMLIAFSNVLLRWSASFAYRILLCESMRAWICPSRISCISSFSSAGTVRLKASAILYMSADK